MDQVGLDRSRSLLEKALALAEAGESLEQVASGRIDGERLAAALSPVAAASSSVRWLVTNGDRVDAVVDAGPSQWRVVFGSRDRQRIDWIDVIGKPERFEGVESGRVVVVNGPSGAGKSTLMGAIGAVAEVPWVVFDEPHNLGAVKAGYLVWRDRAPGLHAGFLDAIAALARAGNYGAVSAAGYSQFELRSRFEGIPTLWIGLHCDEATLLQREDRQDRWGGIAEGTSDAHDGWDYDQTFDTTAEPDPARLAVEVIRAVQTGLAPRQL